MYLNFLKINEKNFFFENGREFTKLVPETELWNSGNHKFWNHEMHGSPVIVKLCMYKAYS